MRRTVVLLAAVLALSGCFGKDEPEEPPDPCPRVDIPKRQLTGAAIRQPAGAGIYEVMPVDGKTRRWSGTLSRLNVGEYTFKGRAQADGDVKGRRGARAEPIAGLADTKALAAYALSYREDGHRYAGRVAVGRPTPGTRMATAGQGHYRGPVKLDVQDRRPEAPGTVKLTGTADIQVRFGSRQVEVRFEDLAPEVASAAALPFERVEWSGIGMCGARVGSTGKGGFQTVGASGRPVAFVGPGAGAPGGSAVLDASFYGFDAETAQPKEIGGVLLVQGDMGIVSGIFTASQIAPAKADPRGDSGVMQALGAAVAQAAGSSEVPGLSAIIESATAARADPGSGQDGPAEGANELVQTLGAAIAQAAGAESGDIPVLPSILESATAAQTK